MGKRRSGIYRALLAGLALATFSTGFSSAQPNDLSGDWKLATTGGSSVQLRLEAQGNSWYGKSDAMELKLNPAGLRNQWVGDFTYEGRHSVKAEWQAPDRLKLTDLEDQQSWQLTRP